MSLCYLLIFLLVSWGAECLRVYVYLNVGGCVVRCSYWICRVVGGRPGDGVVLP